MTVQVNNPQVNDLNGTLVTDYLVLPTETLPCLCSAGIKRFISMLVLLCQHVLVTQLCVLFFFISDLLNEDKTINRRALGKKVFGNKVKFFINLHL